MMGFGGHMSTGGWILSILGILVLVALFVAVTVLLVSSIDGRRAGAPAEPESESAREILDRRLARGELTVEQYDELRAALDGGDGDRGPAAVTASTFANRTLRSGPMPGNHNHPIFARLYPRISHTAELAGANEHRQKLLSDLSGRVVEVGAGHGLNFAYYPQTVTHLVAIEPEPYLRELAREAAQRAPIDVEVTDGTAEALPLEDSAFDAAVASLVLCSVSDQRVALEEIGRVLRPGGELRFYEHVISTRPGWARFQRTLDATIYPPLAGGCHCARDTGAAIRRAGYDVEREERVVLKASPVVPAIPHIIGAARRA